MRTRRSRFFLWSVAAFIVVMGVASLLPHPADAASISSQRIDNGPAFRPTAKGETCINIVPALPAYLEALSFKGYTTRSAEICFPWEGGALRGQFTMTAGWDYEGDNPEIHGCVVQGRTEGTFSGSFTPRIVAERIVGGSFSGNVDNGVTTIATQGPCLSSPDAQGKRHPVIEPMSIGLAGIPLQASVDNGLLRGEVPVAGEIPMIIAAAAVPPGGIEALGPLGQGPLAGILGGLMAAIPLDAQGEILDRLLNEALLSGSKDIATPEAVTILVDAVVDALLTGDASPDPPTLDALAAAAAAGLLPMAAVAVIQAMVGTTAGAVTGVAGGAQGAVEGLAGLDAAMTRRPSGLPATDPWGEPIEIREDGMVKWGQGRGPNGDGWVTQAEAAGLLAESERLIARSNEVDEEFRAASAQMVEGSTPRMVAENEKEAAAERMARDRNERYHNAWETIEESAARRGDLGVLLATSRADLFNDDGTLNQRLIDQLTHATKVRVRLEQMGAEADIAAAQVFEIPGDEEYGSFTTRAVNHLLTPLTWQVHEWGRNPFVRMGSALATGGLSEIGFQAATGLEGIRAAERDAAEFGVDYGLWDAARDGLNTVVDENLPVHALRKADEIWDKASSGQDVTLWDAAELAGDVVVDALNVDTLQNLGRSGLAQGRGAGAQEALFSGKGAPSLFRTWETLARTEVRVSTQGLEVSLRPAIEGVRVPHEAVPENTSTQLWRDPSDADWQTGGPSLQNRANTLEERMVQTVEANRVDPHARVKQESFHQGMEVGQTKVDEFRQAHSELQEATASGDAARVQRARQNLDNAVVELQKDKHAMNALKNDPDAGARATFYEERGSRIEQPAMENTKKRLAETPEFQDADEIVVFNATNNPNPINQGVDLDVTYQQKLKDGTLKDIDHRISGQIHNEELWKLTRPGQEMPVHIDDQGVMTLDRGALQRNADEIDHTVTDGSSHPDAFPGHDVQNILDPQRRGNDLADVEGVGLTAQHKGVERFARADQLVEEAADLAARDLSPEDVRLKLLGSETEKMEGARQLTKTWNKNLGLPRTQAMAAAGNAPEVRIPVDLQQKMTVLERIGQPVGADGSVFTVVDAERTLQSMGMGPRPLDQVAEDLGGFVESVQKLRPPSA